MNNETYGQCRVRLNYGSLVKLTVLLGFCAGLFATPLLLLTSLGKTYGLLNLLIGSPLTGAATGLLLSILGSPVYSWWTTKSNGQLFTGTFQVDTDSSFSAHTPPNSHNEWNKLHYIRSIHPRLVIYFPLSPPSGNLIPPGIVMAVTNYHMKNAPYRL